MARASAVSSSTVQLVAAELFAARGYRGTSMKHIAAALEVRAPSLYNHVASKQALLVAVMDAAMDRALTALDVALAGVDDVGDELRRATESLVLDFLRHPAEVTVCNTEIRSLDEPNRSAIIAKRDAYASRVRAIIERGCRTGRFRTAAPQVASYAVLEMGNSAKAWFKRDGAITDEDVARHYGEFALRIVDDTGRPAGRPVVPATSRRPGLAASAGG